MKKSYLALITIGLFTSIVLENNQADAATSGLYNYQSKMTVSSSNGRIFKDSSLKSSSNVKQGTVYQADGYRNINGKRYYRMYQGSKYCGYMYSGNVKKLTKTNLSSSKKYIALKGKNIWNDLYFKKKNVTLDRERVYETDGYYTLGNGQKYYSLVQYDCNGKRVWKGYTYSGSLRDMKYTSYNKKVVIDKNNYSLWNNLYFSKKMANPNATAKNEQVYKAKGYYYLNGRRYYSLYRTDSNGKEKWWGYIDGGCAKLVDSKSVYNQYFDYKNISDKTGYINTGATLKFYSGPTSNYNYTNRKLGYNTKVCYTDESFNESGNRVKVFKGTKPSSNTFLGWLDRRYIYDSNTTAKMANPEKNHYGVWSEPYGGSKLTTMSTFQKGHIEVNQQYINPKGITQYHIVSNGANAGWVDSNFVLRNQINVPAKISLVRSYKNENGTYVAKWNPLNAVNYATSNYGSVLNPTRDVKVDKTSIDTSKPGTYKVTYSIGTASKMVDVVVRDSESEMEVKYNANPQQPAQGYPKIPYLDQMTNLNYTLSSYKGGSNYGTAPQGDNGYGVSENSNIWTTVKGTPNVTFKTSLFTPYRLSESSNKESMANAETVQPQGLSVIGNKIYVLYKKLDELSSKSNPMKNRGYIVCYDQSKMGKLGDLRQLRTLSRENYSKYASISSGITVGPEIVIGHGQTLTTDGKNLFVNTTNEGENNKDLTGVNSFNKVNPNTLTVSEYTTSRIIATNKSRSYIANRQFFNMAAKDENTFYALYKCNEYKNTKPGTSSAANWEVWESKRQNDGTFKSRQVISLRMPIGIDTPIQGMTYIENKNALYVVTDGGFIGFTLPKSTENTGGSKLIANTKLNSQRREAEGIAYSNGKLYIGSNKGSEVLTASLY